MLFLFSLLQYYFSIFFSINTAQTSGCKCYVAETYQQSAFYGTGDETATVHALNKETLHCVRCWAGLWETGKATRYFCLPVRVPGQSAGVVGFWASAQAHKQGTKI